MSPAPGGQAPALTFPQPPPVARIPAVAPARDAVVVDGHYTRDSHGWLVMKHLAQLSLCSLAVTLAIVTTIPIGVSIAWGITGLVLMSVVVAADRARFIESGLAYERGRFSVIEPLEHSQYVGPMTGPGQLPVAGPGHPHMAGLDPAAYAATNGQPPAPFRATVT